MARQLKEAKTYQEQIENLINKIALRTKLAYQLAIAYGAEGYREPSHFSQKTDRSGNSIYQKTIDQLNTEIKHQ